MYLNGFEKMEKTGTSDEVTGAEAAAEFVRKEEEKTAKRKADAIYARRKRLKKRIESEVLQDQARALTAENMNLTSSNRHLRLLHAQAQDLIARLPQGLDTKAKSESDSHKKLEKTSAHSKERATSVKSSCAGSFSDTTSLRSSSAGGAMNLASVMAGVPPHHQAALSTTLASSYIANDQARPVARGFMATTPTLSNAGISMEEHLRQMAEEAQLAFHNSNLTRVLSNPQSLLGFNAGVINIQMPPSNVIPNLTSVHDIANLLKRSQDGLGTQTLPVVCNSAQEVPVQGLSQNLSALQSLYASQLRSTEQQEHVTNLNAAMPQLSPQQISLLSILLQHLP